MRAGTGEGLEAEFPSPPLCRIVVLVAILNFQTSKSHRSVVRPAQEGHLSLIFENLTSFVRFFIFYVQF